MAMSKVTAKPAAKVQTKVEETKKAEAKPVEIKAEQMKLDVTAEPKKVVEKAVDEKKATVAKKAEEKKPVEKKTAAKKTVAKKTTTAKKETVKKTEKKEAVKAVVNVQFNGKSYETEDFVKIAKDIWKYDLKKKATDFKSVEIYVKPEENRAYYVINGEVDGSFGI